MFMQKTKRKERKGQIAGAFSGLFLVFIFAIFGLSLLPTLASQTAASTNNPNLSGATASMINLLPFVVAAGLVISVVLYFFSLRESK